jgi:hypothetical protein
MTDWHTERQTDGQKHINGRTDRQMGRINLNGKQVCMKGKVMCLKKVACIDFSTKIDSLDFQFRCTIQISDPDLWSRSLIQISDQDLWSRSLIKISDQDLWSRSLIKISDQDLWSRSLMIVLNLVKIVHAIRTSGGRGLAVLNKIRQVFKVTLVTNVLAFYREHQWWPISRKKISIFDFSCQCYKTFFTDDVTKRYFYYWQIFTLVYNLLVRYSDMLHPNSHNFKLGWTKH